MGDWRSYADFALCGAVSPSCRNFRLFFYRCYSPIIPAPFGYNRIKLYALSAISEGIIAINEATGAFDEKRPDKQGALMTLMVDRARQKKTHVFCFNQYKKYTPTINKQTVKVVNKSSVWVGKSLTGIGDDLMRLGR